MNNMWKLGLAVVAFGGLTAIGIAQPGPGRPGGPGGFPGGPGGPGGFGGGFKKAFEAKKAGGEGDLAAEVKALEAKVGKLSAQIEALAKSINKGPGPEPKATFEKKFGPDFREQFRKEIEKKVTEKFGDRFTPEMKKKFEERFGGPEARGPMGKGPMGKGPPGFERKGPQGPDAKGPPPGRGPEPKGPPQGRGPEPKGPPAAGRGASDVDARLAQIERLIEEIRRDLRPAQPGRPGFRR